MAIRTKFPGAQLLVRWILIIAAVVTLQPAQIHGVEMQTQQQCVVLLHGMGRTRFSMSYLEKALTDTGYHVVNHGYPSTSAPIEELASAHLPQALSQCPAAELPGRTPVHFVTHSLGGILVRYYLQFHSLPPGSRMVMLSPPNKGTELADRFKDMALYRWLTGAPGQQLGTSENSLPNKLKPVAIDIGIITGRKTYEPWFSRLLPGEDDGKVSVESAKLAEMSDFLVVDSGHTFIMNDPDVVHQIDIFLKHGRFDRKSRGK